LWGVVLVVVVLVRSVVVPLLVAALLVVVAVVVVVGSVAVVRSVLIQIVINRRKSDVSIGRFRFGRPRTGVVGVVGAMGAMGVVGVIRVLGVVGVLGVVRTRILRAPGVRASRSVDLLRSGLLVLSVIRPLCFLVDV